MAPKKLSLGLWAGMLKNYCHICNQRPPICLIAKFCGKVRTRKFGTKNLGVLGSNVEKPLSYLQSAYLNLSYCKVWCKKQQSLNSGPKVPDFHILELELENIIVIFEASILEFVLTLILVQK